LGIRFVIVDVAGSFKTVVAVEEAPVTTITEYPEISRSNRTEFDED